MGENVKKGKQERERAVWESAAAVILLPAVFVVFGWGAWKSPTYTSIQRTVNATERMDQDYQRWLSDFQQAQKTLTDYDQVKDPSAQKSDFKKLSGLYQKTKQDLVLIEADAHDISGDMNEVTNRRAKPIGTQLSTAVQRMTGDLQRDQTAFSAFLNQSKSASFGISYHPNLSNLTNEQITVDNDASALSKFTG